MHGDILCKYEHAFIGVLVLNLRGDDCVCGGDRMGLDRQRVSALPCDRTTSHHVVHGTLLIQSTTLHSVRSFCGRHRPSSWPLLMPLPLPLPLPLLLLSVAVLVLVPCLMAAHAPHLMQTLAWHALGCLGCSSLWCSSHLPVCCGRCIRTGVATCSLVREWALDRFPSPWNRAQHHDACSTTQQHHHDHRGAAPS